MMDKKAPATSSAQAHSFTAVMGTTAYLQLWDDVLRLYINPRTQGGGLRRKRGRDCAMAFLVVHSGIPRWRLLGQQFIRKRLQKSRPSCPLPLTWPLS